MTVSACALLVLGSCKKFLDQQPITEVGPEIVFNDVSSTRNALAGVYSRLTGDQGYGIRLSLYYTVDTDETQGPTGNNGTSDGERRDIARYGATPLNSQLFNPFSQLFQGIEYANICIDKIPKMDMYSGGSDQQKKQLQRMLGEALTLRAQFYFEAIKNWGDLPAHFQPAYLQASTDPLPFKTDRDTLYNHLLADLKTAEDLVPWRDEIAGIGDAIDERITKGTVKGVRARIALFRGGFSLRSNGTMQRGPNYLDYYKIAKDECNDIITSGKHSLNPSYRGLWKDQVNAHAVTDPNGELMFQASGIGNSGTADTKLGYYNGPQFGSAGNKAINILPSYFYLFDSTDLRRDVTCCYYNINTDGTTKAGTAITAINDGKYRRDWATNPSYPLTFTLQYFSLKWQILRYSDVLLMYAEAENELNAGPSASAYDAINQVRRRGYGKSITTVDPIVDLPAGLNKDNFFKALVRERSLELGSEGVRKFDLIRWNKLKDAITETKANLTSMANLTGTNTYSYMLGGPSYATNSTLPISMYFKTGTTLDDKSLYANSFYTTAPTSTPAGTTKVTWLGVAGTANAIIATSQIRFATNFMTGKGELLPIPQNARDANKNLTQNPNY